MTELLYGIAVAPFKDMAGSPAFFAEVLIGGVFAGLMYSLVALGFVLIFKASGVFNFAQGAMVLYAALTLVGLIERGVPVDRKSTRLNSSHGYISYAVFCLKKKKKQVQTVHTR